jgi:phage terminase large subunit-like protein
MSEAIAKFLELQNQLQRVRETNRLTHYKPYPWQERFHNAVGHGTELPAVEKAAITANQIGKTTAAAFEVAFHLTGLYPDWYKGTRFRTPVDWTVAGNTNEVTRDICQNELFGDPKEDSKLGTGAVPLHLIGAVTRKPGVPNAFETVQVKHVSGRWSAATFKCYEQGPKKFMGLRSNGGWLDEEPPDPILSQVRRSVFSKNPSLILMTFTPEEGATKVVIQLLDQPAKGQAVIRATWDDAPHMTKEAQEQKLATIPEHEREMRTKGEPFAGAGLVFPVLESSIIVEPFEIPVHFRQLGSMDFGFDHPFAACKTVYDADNDTAYLTAEYYVSRQTPAVHVDAVKSWGEWLPWVWPADGLQTEKGSGTALQLQYRTRGLYMMPHHFTNPPNLVEGQQEGQGGIGVEPGLIEMLTRMQSGRYKVFKTCQKFLQERRSYHRDQHGKVVKINDDVISAARYGLMSLRHARTRPVRKVRKDVVAGVSNWG